MTDFKMPSAAWDLLNPEEQQGIHYLVARINAHNMRQGLVKPAVLRPRLRRPVEGKASLPTLPAAIASAKQTITVELSAAETTSVHVRNTVLVVDEMPRADRIERLYMKLRDDNDFKHLADESNFVPGEGKWPNPQAMLIGEAPGAHEDKLRRPFVGQSGNFLEVRLWIAELRRPECFITNVLKWRPPRNRTPNIEEIEAAIPHLRKEVVTVLPDGGLVILLGSVALGVVDPNLKITQCHGEPFTRGPWTFVPMFHPSYVLQGRIDDKVYKADWAKIKGLRADED